MNHGVHEDIAYDRCEETTKTFGVADNTGREVLVLCESCLKECCPKIYKRHVQNGNIKDEEVLEFINREVIGQEKDKRFP
jgi:ATP-dependent protease Clp ATPase subunit